MVEITKEMFQDYVDVQMSGVTNMFDVRRVSDLSGLEKEEIMEIMKNYEKYEAEFGIEDDEEEDDED